jgi:hypothetical protein
VKQDNMQKSRPIVPEQLVQTRNAVIKACGIDTCEETVAPHYEMAQKLVRAWGSNVVAVMLFIGENWLRGRKTWFPIIVEKTKFAPGFRRYFMMFQPKSRILCDFSIDFCYGGTVEYDPDLQDVFLQEALSDPTLEERLAAGMRNFGMKVPVKLLIDAFTEALHEVRKHEPEKLFAE